ncbi:hypothetical protein NMY22_g14704 [Coprinellus aureogranulatus]|nr:hypothetical protein NMY22_g14704 [Coprinellus aureogranulatus]
MSKDLSQCERPSERKPSLTDADTLSHLFTANDAPNERETALLQQEIVSISSRISQTTPGTERAALEQQLHLHRCALSPVRRVPPEILDEIFEHVEEKALSQLALVCHAWNAGATAALARHRSSNLSIEFKPRDGVPCDRIRTWIAEGGKGVGGERSLKLGPEGAAYGSCGHWGYETECYWVDSQFLGLLSELSASSVQLNLGVTICCLQKLLQEEAWHSLSSLKLRIHSITWHNHLLNDDAGASRMYEAALSHLPRALKTLVIGMPPYSRTPYTFSVPPAPYNSLTSLTVESGWKKPVNISAFLRHCASLETLRLNLSYDEGRVEVKSEGGRGNEESQYEVVLPKLHTLVLQNVTPFMAQKALHVLRLPALSHLTLDYPPHTGFQCTDFERRALWTIMDCLGVFSPVREESRLLSLVVRRMEVDAACLAEIFTEIPNLEDLILERVLFNAKEVLDLERARVDTQPILPRLRRLELRGVERRFQMAAFLQYVELRATRFQKLGKSGGGVPHQSERNKLWFVKVQYKSWDEGTRKNWGGCAGIVGRLQRIYGVVVERILSEDEY